MSTPALLRLREAYPAAFIGLLTPAKLAGLWQHHPAVDSVLTFEAGDGPFAIGRRVRAENFGVGLVLPNSFQSALELWCAGVPERVGYAGQWRAWLLTRAALPRPEAAPMRKRSRREVLRAIRNPKSEPRSEAHSGGLHIYQYLHLAAQIGASPAPLAPQLFVTDAEVQTLLGRLGIELTPDQPLFALNPGAEYGSAKRWPAERFIAAAREIQAQSPCRWIVLGGKRDMELAGHIAAGVESRLPPGQPPVGASRAVLNLAGATSLRELCAILKASAVLLTNDTGPMHLGAALGTPVVAVFGSTSPDLTGPGLPGDPRHHLLRARTPCAPCFLRECPIDFRCMASIELGEVVAAVLSCWRASKP
jgi:lipopolysaccharide heptosyltransferase II